MPSRLSRRSFLAVAGAAPLARGAASALRLWYRQAAPDWNEALTIGNGRLGAMVFGGVAEELLQLNENTLYSDEPGQRDLPLDITGDFDRVVEMLRSGEYAEADALITHNWCGGAQGCYQPLGALRLYFDGHTAPASYERELDLGTAISSVRYTHAGVTFTREHLASFPDQALVIRLTADKPRSLTFRATLSSVHRGAVSRSDGSSSIALTGQVPGLALRRTLEWVENRGEQWKYPELWDKDGKRRPNAKPVLYGDEAGGKGMFFDAGLRAVVTDGATSAGVSGMAVRGATEALLVLTAGTSFNGPGKSPSREGVDPAVRSRADLARAAGKSFVALREAHVADYKRPFCRVWLDPGADAAAPTDERIVHFASGNDPALAALYFQFVRHLMIAGSRPGGQPLNLQGLWNRDVVPPWASAYTTNINTQMNYWPAEVANLSECHEPLLRMVRELSITGGEGARMMYKRP